MKFLNESTAVDAHFETSGKVYPRRFTRDQTWLDVSDVGRQWVDTDGRHVLVMVAGRQTFELLLQQQTLAWQIVRGPDERAMG